MDLGSMLFFRTSSNALYFFCYLSFGEGHSIDFSVFTNRNIQKTGQCIHNTGSHTVQSTGNLITGAAEFSAGMKHGKNNFQSGFSRFFLQVYRNSSAIILYGNGIVLMNGYGNIVAKTGQSLIHGIIHYFINQVM